MILKYKRLFSKILYERSERYLFLLLQKTERKCQKFRSKYILENKMILKYRNYFQSFSTRSQSELYLFCFEKPRGKIRNSGQNELENVMTFKI